MMKSILLVLLLSHVLIVDAQTDIQKLTQTIKEFHKALVDKNTISINQQTDKALSFGHSNGWVQTKTDVMTDLETGKLEYKSYKEDSLSIVINGLMANARFVADIDAKMSGVENKFHLKVLEVWVKKSNRWLLFARQGIK